jgi:hypothetical protein
MALTNYDRCGLFRNSLFEIDAGDLGVGARMGDRSRLAVAQAGPDDPTPKINAMSSSSKKNMIFLEAGIPRANWESRS